jgi:hypothetical protein
MRRMILLTVLVLAGCIQPPPPLPIAGGPQLDGVMTGVAVIPEIGATPCEAQVEYKMTLIEDFAVVITSNAKTWGTCPFEAWRFDAFVTCDDDCGEVDLPMAYWPMTVQLDFTRVPDYAHLTIHLVASIYGYTDGAYKQLPVIRCTAQCYFQPA